MKKIKLSNTQKTAFGGIIVALSIIFLTSSNIIPYFTYVTPVFAGFLTAIAVLELNKTWASMIYSAVSLISIFILIDKEAALCYVLFFGYYPIFKSWIDNKKLSKLFKKILKYLLFNISFFIIYLITKYILCIPIEDFNIFGKYSLLVIIIISNILFFAYELAISTMQNIYKIFFQKKLRNLFKK